MTLDIDKRRIAFTVKYQRYTSLTERNSRKPETLIVVADTPQAALAEVAERGDFCSAGPTYIERTHAAIVWRSHKEL